MQKINVQKSTISNAITENLVVSDGTSVTPDGTGSIIATDISGTLPAGKITGLATVATSGSYLDLSHLPTLGTAAAKDIAFFAQTANNLSDLASASGARTNLGLGGAAVLSVGTTAGTVAAGNDSRFDQIPLKIPLTEKGAALGVATLDAGGKIPLSEIPDSIISQLTYKGTWDALTNTPTLPTTPGASTQGDFYIVTVAGTFISIDWYVGDWIISDGSAWSRVANTNQVTSVFGRMGAVASANGDYTASQLTNVPAGSIAAITVQAALNELDSEKLAIASNLSDLNSASTARTNLGLGSISTQAASNVAITGGTITDTTVSGLTLTTNAAGFSVAGGTASKTLKVDNTLELAGTDGSTLNVGTGGTLGTAAFTAATAYATAAQGTKADNAGAVNGIIKSDGAAAFSAAVAGTDFVSPTGSGAGLSGIVTTITGTTNQVIASASTGAVTLSLPQSIGTGSTVQFGGITSTPISGSTGSFTTLSASTSGLVNRSGTAAPATIATNALQLVGNSTESTNLQIDTFGGTPVVYGRRADGAPGAPTATQSGEDLLFLSGRGFGATAYSTDAARITFQATQNFTDSAIGSKIILQVAPTGSTTLATAATITSTGIAANLTGDVTGKINKITITAPATGATLTIADGKTFTSSNTLMLAGTDGSTLNIGTGGTLGTAAFTNASAYVPYTGATGSVDLNNQSLTNINHLGVGSSVAPDILLRVVGDNGSLSRIAMRGYSSDVNGSAIRVTKFRGSSGTPQVPVSGDSLGRFEFAGYTTTTADGLAGAHWEAFATETWGATGHGTKAILKITPNTTTTPVAAITVDQDKSASFAGAIAITGAAGTGYATFIGQSSNPASPAAGTLLIHSKTVNGFTRMEQDNEAATNVVYGRDNVFIARNPTGSTIAKGATIYVSGTNSGAPEVQLARANSSSTLPCVGIAMDAILAGGFGQVMYAGLLTFDTSAFSVGNQVWVSTGTAGGLTATRPSGTTNSVQRMGTILVSGNATTGLMLVQTSPALLNMETGTNAATWSGTNISLGGTVNKLTLTAPATAATLTIADGKTLTVSNSLTLSGTDASTLNIGTGGTLGTAAYTAASAYSPVAGSASIVTTGALNSGSITSGFGSIDVGTDAISGGTITASTMFSGPHNGTVGATTPAAGSFTTLGASGQISHLLSANSGVTGFSSQNSNAGTSAYLLSSLNNGTNLLNSYILGVNWSGTFLTGGPTTQSAGIYTSANIPISIGINNAEVARFTSTGLNSTVIGATTPAAGTFTAISATGEISSTIGNNSRAFYANGASTGYLYGNIANTSGGLIWGVENSTGGGLIAGSTANDAIVRGVSGIAFSANGGGNMQMRLSATGLAVTGALSSTGQIYSSADNIKAIYNGGGSNNVGLDLKDSSDTSSTYFAGFRKASGTIIGSITRVTTTDAVIYNTTSDARLKENFRDFRDSGRLIDALRPRIFDWKSDTNGDGKNVVGFIAQEENAADPIFAHIGAVSVGDDDPTTITRQWQRSDSALVPIAIAELKALRARVAALEAKFNSITTT